jgi:hypothetical protein
MNFYVVIEINSILNCMCMLVIRYEKCRKITARLICPIVVHFLEIDEKLNYLLGTIQTFFVQKTT